MKTNIIAVLSEKKKIFEKKIEKVSSRIRKAPSGTLSIHKKGNNSSYYWNIPENGNWKKQYIGKSEMSTISQLAYSGKSACASRRDGMRFRFKRHEPFG